MVDISEGLEKFRRRPVKRESIPVHRIAWEPSRQVKGYILDKGQAGILVDTVLQGLMRGSNHRAMGTFTAENAYKVSYEDGAAYTQWLVAEANKLMRTYFRGFTPEDNEVVINTSRELQRQFSKIKR